MNNDLHNRGYLFQEAFDGMLGACRPGEWLFVSTSTAEVWTVVRYRTDNTSLSVRAPGVCVTTPTTRMVGSLLLLL